ncbi:MAG: hypothetical protein EBX40_03125 [Gammaproteobacteria bacterium]|nr:hypothetical protein [Gammaproteobacteria bacterium]
MADQIERASTELSVLVPELWSAKYYDVLLAALPMADTISKDYQGEIQNLGDTVNVSQFPEFGDAVELAEDQKNDAAAITVSQIQLIINKRIAQDFIITNLAMMQALPAMEKLQELAIYSILKKVQSLILSLIVPSAAAPDHSIAYTNGTTLALADILAAKELLDNQDVPMSNRHMCVGAAQLNDMFNITGFTSTDFGVSNAPLLNGGLPSQILGFMPHFSSLFGNTSYFYHSSFFQMATQQGMNVSVYDLGVDGKRAQRVNCDTLLGLKQFDNLRVVTIA